MSTGGCSEAAGVLRTECSPKMPHATGLEVLEFEGSHSEATSASGIVSLAFPGFAGCSPEESKLLLLLSPTAFYTKLISLIMPLLIFTRFRRSSIPLS